MQGAVFSSLVFRGRTPRPTYDTPTLVAKWGNTQVIQTFGEQLDQGDADVYFELVRRVTQQEGLCLNITSDEFLNSINRKRGSESRNWLKSSIERLMNAKFDFSIEGVVFSVKLLASVEHSYNGKTVGDFSIFLSEEVGPVFNAGKTIIKSSVRHALGNDAFAKWLHCFYSSHSKQHESKVSIDKLKLIAGRENMRNDRFESSLIESINNLQRATGWIINLNGNVLSVKQSHTATDLSTNNTKKPKTAKTKPSPKTTNNSEARNSEWDNIKSIDDLEKLDLSQLKALMNEESKAAYLAKRATDRLDYSEWKKAAIAAIARLQLYRELGRRPFDPAAYKSASAEDFDI